MNYPQDFLAYSASIDIKLTSLRKSILYILWQENKPLKAYEILNELQQSKKNSQAPTVYRVLDYFVSAGLVHKIESIQAYTLCIEPKKHLASEILMVCSDCYQVREIHDQDLRNLVQALATRHCFSLAQDAIELKGSCQNCHVCH